MRRDRFFDGDRRSFDGNGGGRRPPRRSDRMPEPDPEPEDEKTWNESEREKEVAHFEELGRSMQKGVQIEVNKQQAPSPSGYTKEQLADLALMADTASKHVRAVEARVRSDLEAQQAIALTQRPVAVNVTEPKMTKKDIVTLGVGAFIVGGIIGFLIGRSTR